MTSPAPTVQRTPAARRPFSWPSRRSASAGNAASADRSPGVRVGGAHRLDRERRFHHRARSSARRRGPRKEEPGGTNRASGQALGGLTAKVHLAVDGRGLPLSIVVTAGNVNDWTAFAVLRHASSRPRCRPGGDPPVVAGAGGRRDHLRTP
ncbi:transposase [Actinomadura sp. NEAU-AAG7]|uniref:transposase n=1 Tax=Actinomadura sp. NEAU-AAG7 TaxID=2839640 RepID=UPI0035B1900A